MLWSCESGIDSNDGWGGGSSDDNRSVSYSGISGGNSRVHGNGGGCGGSAGSGDNGGRAWLCQ